MAKHSKKEFADLCNIETKNLSVYITRRKVSVLPDDTIDDKDPVNVAFLQRRKVKLGNEEVETVDAEEVTNVQEIKNPKSKHKRDKEEEEHSKTIAQLDKLKLELDVQKKKADLEKIQLSNAKLKGEIIPFGLIKPLIVQNNQSLTTEFKNAADELILEMAKKKSFSSAEVADLNKTLVGVINVAHKKAFDASMKSLDLIISEYKETIK